MKSKVVKTAVSLALVAGMSAGLFGCGSGGTKTSDLKFETDGKYPMQTDAELRIWQNFTPNQVVSSMNDTEFKKYLEEATGVKITYEHPPVGASDAFNLMMASDDIPDIVITSWRSPSMDEYCDTGAIEDLTPYIEGGVMPNLKKILDDNPEYPELAKSPKGKYLYAPMILGDDILRSYRSYVVRGDLLEKAGLEAPETIDEWETMLKKFKEMGVKIPLNLDISWSAIAYESQFTSPFGFVGNFYHDGDTVKYGFIEEGFKDYLRTMARWYKEGLLDSNFMDKTSSRISQIITSGECGAFYANVGGGLGTYMNAVDKNSGIKFEPVKIPVKNKGDRALSNNTQRRVHSVGAAISADCKNKEIAARFLDFGYSEEGQKIWNFGKEGVSYEMAKDEDGVEYPKYTSIITDPAKRGEGVSMSQQLTKYASTGNPISVQSKYYLLQVNNTPEQKKMLEYANDSDCDKYLLPEFIFTTDEQKEITDKMTPIQTYIDETMVKIVAGKMDLEKGIEEFYAQLHSMGIDEVLEKYQKAYDSYLAKKK